MAQREPGRQATQAELESDPFDTLYEVWAEHAMNKRLDPPSRGRWDMTVLRLLLSEDPDRVRRYRRISADGPETLGSDAYDLWKKMPSYTPNLTAPVKTWPELREYEKEHLGSMRRLMESQGLLDRYNEIMEVQAQYKIKTRRAQQSVLLIGCAGIGVILIMFLAVLLIIAIELAG